MRVLSAILCDDIRQESNGKAILIGVYSGGIVVDKFPANPQLNIWLNVISDDAAHIDSDFKVIIPPDTEVLKGRLSIDPPVNVGAVVTAGPFVAPLTEEGYIIASWSNNGGDWEEVGRWPVSVNKRSLEADAPSSAPLPG